MKPKKIIAPLGITLLLVMVLIAYLVTVFMVSIPFFLKLLGVLFIAALVGVAVFVCIERINEIRSGEEDDLSKY